MALPFLEQAFIDIVVDGRCPQPVIEQAVLDQNRIDAALCHQHGYQSMNATGGGLHILAGVIWI